MEGARIVKNSFNGMTHARPRAPILQTAAAHGKAAVLSLQGDLWASYLGDVFPVSPADASGLWYSLWHTLQTRIGTFYYSFSLDLFLMIEEIENLFFYSYFSFLMLD